MSARIYRPARTATQSGCGKTRLWVLQFDPTDARRTEPLMGWVSSSDTQSQVTMHFPTRQSAETYARAHGIEYAVEREKSRKVNIRSGGYGENFAATRRGAWTH